MDAKTPLVSFCIITYNQEKYIEEAINSALNQTYDNMEIIISDDCSTDDTPNIIKRVCEKYNGPHRIVININEQNMGIREHCNKILYSIAKGEILLLAGGDDVSDHRRTQIYVEYFNRFPEVMSISCKSVEVDEDMKEIYADEEWDNSFSIFNINDYIEHRDFLIYSGDSRGIRRNVINSFPPLKYPRAEDIHLFIRSMLIGSGCYLRIPLVKRRNHRNNASKVRSQKYDLFKMQEFEDIKYAREKGYITCRTEKAMYDKVLHVKEVMELYWNPATSNLKTLFYRALSRLFDVRKR